MIEANKHIFAEHLLDLMRLIYAVLILLLALITSAQCQKTAKDWVDEGIALAQQGKYDEALQALDKAIEINPKDEASWINKGAVLANQGKYDEAIKAYDEAIEINSQDANLWEGKGDALKALGRTKEADDAFTKAKELGYSG